MINSHFSNYHDRQYWSVEEFISSFNPVYQDILEEYDETMKSTSEYWGNLMGYKLLDYANDEYLENDLAQALIEKLEVKIVRSPKNTHIHT